MGSKLLADSVIYGKMYILNIATRIHDRRLGCKNAIEDGTRSPKNAV